ncbi:NADH dehydrogenase subunit E [Panacagrimonas perspica]|uniref:NADH-quinone oxidoreductase subunit E n=1 Tax=Panacagrimonas perspica TaxID=381431 RepID=A0A4R7P4U1_9GAMM|nr:NADH-quinone oxidoreductase subunit NuoE [Panacagrimonas perspica]TDU28814.1 NADH dehydrogenase subunit E [Panacagrimonas perspica]THD02353.1 NADH-quinone oxidoreductase subunit E [Panacagrimonas perspica]
MQKETVIKLADLGKAPPFALSDAERHEIEEEIHHYPDSRAASIGALKIVQKHRGWVPDAAIPQIAKMIGSDAADLEGVATFYSLIFRQPVGRHVITVCDSISCHLTGYDELKTALEAKLGIRYGQTTPDQRFTLLNICCLGACDRGPTMMIDEDLHGDVDPAGLDQILGAYS